MKVHKENMKIFFFMFKVNIHAFDFRLKFQTLGGTQIRTGE